MKKSFYFLVSTLCGAAGIIFFLIQHDFIILQLPFKSIEKQPSEAVQKNLQLNTSVFFVHGDKILHEKIKLSYAQLNEQEQTDLLAKKWLAKNINERNISPHITITSTAININENYIFICFNESFLNVDWGINQNWLLLQTLLKTLHSGGIKRYGVLFCVDDKPMSDRQLDFSQPITYED